MQYDTPEAILANPANDMVAGFVGADASLKQLTLTRVRDVELLQCPTAHQDGSIDDLRRTIASRKRQWGLILDHRNRPLRWVSPAHLAGATSLRDVGDPVGDIVSVQSTLQDALEALLAQRSASTVVTGRRGEYAGLITIDTLVDTLRTTREEHAGDHDEDAPE